MIIAENVLSATYLERKNKFLVSLEIEIKNKKTIVDAFLPDPGRLTELLIPGRHAYAVHIKNKPHRKTEYDMIAIDHGELIVSVDTRVPNKYVNLLLQNQFLFPFTFDKIKPEFTFGNSRLDFLAIKGNERYLIEVKSVTLVENGLALFPDAPTTRGTRHVLELIESIRDGYIPVIIFVIQRSDALHFKPHKKRDPEFNEALLRAKEDGVKIIVFKSRTFLDNNNFCMEPVDFVNFAF